MKYQSTISLDCPYCVTKCQFVELSNTHRYCTEESSLHIAYTCGHCNGVITTHWVSTTADLNQFKSPTNYLQELHSYHPVVGDWKPRVDISLIKHESVQRDFNEAISAYNHGLYNACMMMARRSIQQEMILNKIKGKDLYQQIEATGISPKQKALLHKVKNFGNSGAHPDFCLYDEDGNEIENKKAFAKLSLEFLDRYFADEYEIDSLVESAPKSKKEMEQKKT